MMPNNILKALIFPWLCYVYMQNKALGRQCQLMLIKYLAVTCALLLASRPL